MNMHCEKDDSSKIIKIMLRAASCMSFESRGSSRLEVTMDLTACHLNGCPLDLDGLLNAGQGDFMHDVAGIMRHINRRTGQLENCFLPRYASVQRQFYGRGRSRRAMP